MKTDVDRAAISVTPHGSDEEAGRRKHHYRPRRCLAYDGPHKGRHRHGMSGRVR